MKLKPDRMVCCFSTNSSAAVLCSLNCFLKKRLKWAESQLSVNIAGVFSLSRQISWVDCGSQAADPCPVCFVCPEGHTTVENKLLFFPFCFCTDEQKKCCYTHTWLCNIDLFSSLTLLTGLLAAEGFVFTRVPTNSCQVCELVPLVLQWTFKAVPEKTTGTSLHCNAIFPPKQFTVFMSVLTSNFPLYLPFFCKDRLATLRWLWWSVAVSGSGGSTCPTLNALTQSLENGSPWLNYPNSPSPSTLCAPCAMTSWCQVRLINICQRSRAL